MAMELVVKDIDSASAAGKDAGVPKPMAGLMFQLAPAVRGAKPHEHIAMKRCGQWAAIENRAK